MRIVLGVSGGIAAYKACLVLRLLTEAGHRVDVIPTEAALRFVGAPTWEALSGRPVTTTVWDRVPEVNHVRLGQEADLVLIAPATADLVARAAHGLADDLLTTTLLTARCPVVMAPAMHTEMWQHAATRANVDLLRERGVHVIEPDSGRLTGVDTGPGRLPDPERIVTEALGVVGATPVEGRRDLLGHHVVVTAGGTREPLDPVRFLGNRSSGKQGYALAATAAARGARVTLISANVALDAPPGCEIVPVGTALELQAAVQELVDGPDTAADVVVMAAAVADFRPASYTASKIKKTHDGPEDETAPTIALVRNPDILAGLVSARRERGADRPYLVGFAAETGDGTHDVLTLAAQKLQRKGCDLLVANEVGEHLTFGADDTTVHLLTPGASEPVTVGPAGKDVVADAVWDVVVGELAGSVGAAP